MFALPLERRLFTPEEYLIIEREAEYRSEYIDGKIYPMAEVNDPHIDIADNLTAEVSTHLRDTIYSGGAHDRKVRTNDAGFFAYPDYSIICGEKQFHDSVTDILLNPTVIIEILSPSREKFDRTTKFDRYKQIETLQDYVFVSQDSPRIERYTRADDGTWNQQTAIGLDAEIALTGAPVVLKLASIYDRITFPPEG